MTIPVDFKGLQPAYVSAVEKKTKKSINGRLSLDDGNVWYNDNMTTATLSGKWVLDKIKEDTLITFHFWPRNVKAEIDVSVFKGKNLS